MSSRTVRALMRVVNGMSFDEALDAILSLEVMWAGQDGRVHLDDLGVGAYRLVWTTGQCMLPPERWRGYPGGRRRSTNQRDRGTSAV